MSTWYNLESCRKKKAQLGDIGLWPCRWETVLIDEECGMAQLAMAGEDKSERKPAVFPLPASALNSCPDSPATDYCWKCKLKSSFCPHHLWPWHCITATGKELAEELMDLLLWWTWAHCLGRLWKGLQLWAGKVIKSSELNRLFCGAMEDKNVGEILDSGGLSCEVYKWRKDHFVRFWIKNL